MQFFSIKTDCSFCYRDYPYCCLNTNFGPSKIVYAELHLFAVDGEKFLKKVLCVLDGQVMRKQSESFHFCNNYSWNTAFLQTSQQVKRLSTGRYFTTSTTKVASDTRSLAFPLIEWWKLYTNFKAALWKLQWWRQTDSASWSASALSKTRVPLSSGKRHVSGPFLPVSLNAYSGWRNRFKYCIIKPNKRICALSNLLRCLPGKESLQSSLKCRRFCGLTVSLTLFACLWCS